MKNKSSGRWNRKARCLTVGAEEVRTSPLNDFADLAVLARLNEFERRYNEVAEPSDWRFTRAAVAELMARLARNEPCLRLAARTS